MSHNEQYYACNVSYALDVWDKSDLTTSEVNSQLNGLIMSDEVQIRAIFAGGHEIKTADVNHLNYVDMGYVAGVLNQGYCASCWACAA